MLLSFFQEKGYGDIGIHFCYPGNAPRAQPCPDIAHAVHALPYNPLPCFARQVWAPSTPVVVFDLGFTSEQLARIRCWKGVQVGQVAPIKGRGMVGYIVHVFSEPAPSIAMRSGTVGYDCRWDVWDGGVADRLAGTVYVLNASGSACACACACACLRTATFARVLACCRGCRLRSTTCRRCFASLSCWECHGAHRTRWRTSAQPDPVPVPTPTPTPRLVPVSVSVSDHARPRTCACRCGGFPGSATRPTCATCPPTPSRRWPSSWR